MNELSRHPLRIRLNVIVAVIGFIANALLAYISYRLILQAGGVALVGLWSALVAVTFLIRIGDLGLGGAAVKFLASLPVEASSLDKRRLIDTVLLGNMGLFLVLALIGSVVLPEIFPWISGLVAGSPDTVLALRVLPILLFGFFLQGVALPVLAVLQGLHHGFLSSILSTIGVVVQMICALVLIPRMGLMGFAWAMVAQQAVTILLGWGLSVRLTASLGYGILPLNFSRASFSETVRYGVTLQASNLLTGLFEPIAKLLVGRTCGLEALGTFELVYKVVNVIRGAVIMAIIATIPAAASLMGRDMDAVKALYRTTVRKSRFVILCAVGGLVLGSPAVSYLWFERIDETFVIALVLIAIGAIGNIYGAPAYSLGLASGRLRGIMIATSSTVLVLSLLVPLGAQFGELEAIGGVAVAMIVGGVLMKVLNERILFQK